MALTPVLVAAADKPDWVSGVSAAHPKSAFLIGVGHGPTQQKAADKARAELAKSFSTSIEANTSVSARETLDGSGSNYSQSISDDVRASTAKVLDGVEIAQYWQGPDGHYALAVLNREHSLKIFRDKLEEFDRDFADLSSALGKAEGKFSRLRTALRMLRLVKDRRRINEDFRVLNPEGKGIPAPASYSDVVAKARKAAVSITFQVEVTGKDGEALTSRVIDALNVYGLKAVEKNPRTPDILVEAKAQGAPLPAENLLWVWAKGSILVRMSYGATGEVFTRFEQSGQEAARDSDSAVDAVLKGLCEKTADHVFKVVMSAELADD